MTAKPSKFDHHLAQSQHRYHPAGAPGGPQAQLQLGGAVEVDEEKPRVLALPPASSVSDVAKALNALKVTPRDIIAIFQALKKAGALRAELSII